MNVLARFRLAGIALGLAAALAACGGGDGYGGNDNATSAAATACSLDEQKSWLASYMNDAYLWYATQPNPDPAQSPSIQHYFDALLTDGVAGNRDLPRDRWSYTESAASYNQFFIEGRTLGYGLAVAGREIQAQPDRPLRVRYVEPASPAAVAGIARGETIVSINGTPTAALNDHFSVLNPAAPGDVLRLVLRNAQGAERPVDLTAQTHDLVPVSDARVVQSPAGTPIGYVVLKDFISQSLSPLEAAFASFKAFNAAGVREIVLDLRYNGGGLVSVARTLAGYVAGDPAANQTFTLLRHNDKHPSRSTTFRFPGPGEQPSAMGATRVFVLTGSRTCSASELVVSGLRPFVDVVQIGDVTCGKPVGFVPVDRCGTTFSAVNFESLNAAGDGRYWDGLTPRCAVADDLDHALGDASEALLAAARGYVDSGACPVAASREQPTRLRDAMRRVNEGERPGTMIAR